MITRWKMVSDGTFSKRLSSISYLSLRLPFSLISELVYKAVLRNPYYWYPSQTGNSCTIWSNSFLYINNLSSLHTGLLDDLHEFLIMIDSMDYLLQELNSSDTKILQTMYKLMSQGQGMLTYCGRWFHTVKDYSHDLILVSYTLAIVPIHSHWFWDRFTYPEGILCVDYTFLMV